ncbi:MAG TPA: DUF1289 domain-containing protein [Cellvibrio sp.]|nr:DUF1289 domain-containing protein [Cellvibrio sp.]
MVVESPCIRNCCLDDNDICIGCHRSLAEITRWSLVNDSAKLEILAAAKSRRALHLRSQLQSDAEDT